MEFEFLPVTWSSGGEKTHPTAKASWRGRYVSFPSFSGAESQIFADPATIRVRSLGVVPVRGVFSRCLQPGSRCICSRPVPIMYNCMLSDVIMRRLIIYLARGG